jgi:hypothetical protein
LERQIHYLWGREDFSPVNSCWLDGRGCSERKKSIIISAPEAGQSGKRNYFLSETPMGVSKSRKYGMLLCRGDAYLHSLCFTRLPGPF